jgi:Tol biopolymer transport system component
MMHIFRVRSRFVLFAAFILLCTSGCASNIRQQIPFSIVSSPQGITGELAHLKVLLYTADDSIYVTSLDQKDVRILSTVGNDYVISPDGNKLAYSTLDQIWVEDIQTGDQHAVISKDDLNVKAVEYPSFYPGGENLIFQYIDYSGNFGLGTVNVDSAKFQRLNVVGLNNRPKISPTNEHILSICEGDGVVGFEVCIMNFDGKNKKHLTNVEGYHWAWFSPDGNMIVFSRLQTRLLKKNKAGLYTMNLDGSDVKLLVDWYSSVLGFSSDGKQIVFCKTSNEGGCEGIYIVNLDGTNLMKLEYFDTLLKEIQ